MSVQVLTVNRESCSEYMYRHYDPDSVPARAGGTVAIDGTVYRFVLTGYTTRAKEIPGTGGVTESRRVSRLIIKDLKWRKRADAKEIDKAITDAVKAERERTRDDDRQMFNNDHGATLERERFYTDFDSLNLEDREQ
jgi:hypothetical protein